MHRICVLTAALALLVPSTASAQTTYGIAGVEVNPSPATFVGKVTQNGAAVGGFYTQVPHTALSNNAATPATICTPIEPAPCGTFALATASRTVIGAFLGGTITFAGFVSSGDGCPDETYNVAGVLTSGSFNVLLRHLRKFPLFGCPIIGATVNGAAVIS